MVYSTPNGDSFNELRSRIQAVGVALLFTYTVIIYSFLVEFCFSSSCGCIAKIIKRKK